MSFGYQKKNHFSSKYYPFYVSVMCDAHGCPAKHLWANEDYNDQEIVELGWEVDLPKHYCPEHRHDKEMIIA